MTANRVIFVDDDLDVRTAIGQSLELEGYDVVLARAFIEATDHITPGFPGIIVTDVRMPGKDGFDLLERALKIDRDLPVIVLTGEADVPMAVRAMAAGAYDFLEKPCPPKSLLAAVARALEKRRLVLDNRRLHAERNVLAAVRGQTSLAAQMEMAERLLIEEALREQDGRVVNVAETLGLPRKTLYDKLKRHGIDPAAFRASADSKEA